MFKMVDGLMYIRSNSVDSIMKDFGKKVTALDNLVASEQKRLEVNEGIVKAIIEDSRKGSIEIERANKVKAKLQALLDI